MNIIPFVYPDHQQEGVELSLKVEATFDFALEEGSIDKNTAFLVKKTVDYNNSLVEPVEAKVSVIKLEKNTVNSFAGKDYGDDPNSGELYRSKILIEPLSLLSQHTEYSILLSKDISAITVFDPKPGVSNSGDIPLFKGPYIGLIEEEYIITIDQSGDYSNTIYSWVRSSDNHSESGIVARKRFIELDMGLFIKFNSNNYVSGDTFSVKVRPQQILNTTIVWDFTTGDEVQLEPEDSRSNSVVELPVVGQDAPLANSDFFLKKTVPYDGKTMVKPGKKGFTVIGPIIYSTREKTAEYNGVRVKILETSDPASFLYFLNNELVIEVISGTTNQEVVDLVNNSSTPFQAETSLPNDITQLHASGKLIEKGVTGDVLTFTFSKNINESIFSENQISVFYESLTGVEKGSLDFTYEIIDNKLIIKF